jgi:hypothetical protein
MWEPPLPSAPTKRMARSKSLGSLSFVTVKKTDCYGLPFITGQHCALAVVGGGLTEARIVVARCAVMRAQPRDNIKRWLL